MAGRNLKTWTSGSGRHPETLKAGGTSNFNQSEFNTQPLLPYLMVLLSYALRAAMAVARSARIGLAHG